MTEYRATPEQWTQQEKWVRLRPHDADDSSCILELRARVEALEAAQRPHQDKLDRLIEMDRADSLVERVAGAIHPSICADTYLYRHEARAAIREVAAWIGEQDPEPGRVGRWLGQVATPCGVMADLLRQQADR